MIFLFSFSFTIFSVPVLRCFPDCQTAKFHKGHTQILSPSHLEHQSSPFYSDWEFSSVLFKCLALPAGLSRIKIVLRFISFCPKIFCPKRLRCPFCLGPFYFISYSVTLSWDSSPNGLMELLFLNKLSAHIVLVFYSSKSIQFSAVQNSGYCYVKLWTRLFQENLNLGLLCLSHTLLSDGDHGDGNHGEGQTDTHYVCLSAPPSQSLTHPHHPAFSKKGWTLLMFYLSVAFDLYHL